MNRIAWPAVIALSLTMPAAAFDFERERERTWDFLADQHAALGKLCAKAGLYADAHSEYQRALDLIPEHKQAMEGLGYRLRREGWEEDELLPDKNELQGEELKKVREYIEVKERQKRYKQGLSKLERLIRQCEREGLTGEIIQVYGQVIYYDPDHEAARTARGFVRREDGWERGETARARARAEQILGASPEGDLVEGEDPQARAAGTTFVRRRTDPLLVRTSTDDERCRHLMRVGGAALTLSRELLGQREGEPLKGTRFTLTILADRPQFEYFIDHYTGADAARRAFMKKLAGTWQAPPTGEEGTALRDRPASKPWGYIIRTQGRSDADHCANTVALVALGHKRGHMGSAPWIFQGFSYLVTAQLLETVSTQRFKMSKGTQLRTDTGPQVRKWSGPDRMRAATHLRVERGDHTRLADLAAIELNDFTFEHAAQAFSVFEFLTERHPEWVAAWLANGPKSEAAEELKQLEQAAGVSIDEIEARWREWVASSY